MSLIKPPNVIEFPGASRHRGFSDFKWFSSVSGDCAQILNLNEARNFPVYFDRIPPHNVSAMRFFQYISASGFVSVLTQDANEFWDDAILSITEPENGESFFLPFSDFIRFVHPLGEISDPEERESFLLNTLESFGLRIEFQQGEYVQLPRQTEITEEKLDEFFPEAIPLIGGGMGSSFTCAHFSGRKVEDAVGMEIVIENFHNPESMNLLKLVAFLDDDCRSDGYDIPKDSILSLFSESGDCIKIPVSLIRSIILRAIARLGVEAIGNDLRLIWNNAVQEEESLLDRFFWYYVLPHIPAE